MNGERIEHLIAERASGRLSRRQLARRLTLLGLSAPAIAGVLATYGGDAAAQEASPEAGADDIITSPSFAGQSLVVTSYGGTWEEFMRAEVLPDFEAATGATVELAVGLSNDWMTTMRAAGLDNPPYDVVIANETWISTARIEGNFEALTEERVPNLQDVAESLRMPDDIGVLALVSPLGLASMTEAVAEGPTTWAGLADFMPQVGIYNIANSAAAQHILMMAEILTGDYMDWEPGFDWIRDNLQLARQTDFSGNMEQLLTLGEVNVGILDSPAWARLSTQGIAMDWSGPEEGLMMFEQNTNVTVGSQAKDLAYSFVNYWLGVGVQTKFAEVY
ncbi:MAG: extracellular solute-binding protein, partial [Chloroflexota bacterium]|nr:extracellular solute-binding protein [Chloroflexota bacterium]